ncbi:aspartate/glutamate racemase family protein [Methylobacterium sp. J-048]|uniref:aspartate/glutamate racemase family protein n=1 Tax=Methylobacterium sp. J-048 TaxID=2836635 RepID=UPI001FB923F3|nr:aspartate/glutamate racemase family protein [Methylobacterium sp. J-048]MCJ2060328.1 aspartate/glutamate racemase family protein [Methylobacterium sp. J-048]
MRILLINPNTSQAVTDLVAGHVRRQIGDRAELRAVTGRFGARYIASRAASAIAGHAALDAMAKHGDACDAVYLACFGDPGLFALRELSPVPVIGMADAACHEAAATGRFGIVTGGAAWGPMLREFVGTIGLAERLADITTVAASGGAIAEDPDRALNLLAQACRDCHAAGADTVILGGAGLAGLARRLAPEVPCPLICSVEAGTRAVLTAATALRQLSCRPTPIASIGLGPALAHRLATPDGTPLPRTDPMP